ncbi:MAG: MG2 domain-containing protein [Bacteroidia bacterium]|nr:MG2 domain-containing protein [Bacteroidia bacterium]
MRREILYVFFGLIFLGLATIFWGKRRANFEVPAARVGIPPGSQAFVVRCKGPLPFPLPSVLFRLGPEGQELSHRQIGEDAVLVFTGSPLEAGRTYRIEAVEGTGLRGTIELPVQPLRVEIDKQPYYDGSLQPALLARANGPLDSAQICSSVRAVDGSPLSVEWLWISKREALLVPPSSVGELQVVGKMEEGIEIQGGKYAMPPYPGLAVREISTEEEGGQLRVRLRLNRWLQLPPEVLSSYIRIGNYLPFSVEVKGIDVYLYLQERPLTSFRVEVLAGFPGEGERLSDTQSFLLTPPGNAQLAWYHPYVHFLPPGTPLLFYSDGSEEVQLAIWRIFPQNARLFFRQKAEDLWTNYPLESDSPWWDLSYDWWGGDTPMESYGQLIRKAKIPVRALPRLRVKGQTVYGLGEDLPPGMYYVEIQGKESWTTLRTWIVVGHYALLARRGEREVTLWAVHQETGEPLSSVSLQVWGPAGQQLAAGKTDRQGQATFALPEGIDAEGIWAEWGGEVNYLSLRLLRPGRWAFETQGVQPSRGGWLVYMQPGRTLFRPGEEIIIAGFLRKVDVRYPDQPIPLWGRLRDPRGQTRWEGPLPKNKEGRWVWRHLLPLSAPTGLYNWEVFRQTSLMEGEKGEELIGQLTLQVEFFRPNRLSVAIQVQRREQVLDATLQSAFFYGAVGAGLQGEMEIRWRSLPPPGELAAGYVWEVQVPDSALGSFRRQIPFITDARGVATVPFPLPIGWGYGEVVLQAQVRDDEGRPNPVVRTFPQMTQPYLVGMKRLPSFVEGGTPVIVPIRALQRETFKQATASLSVRVEVWERIYEPLIVETPWGSLRHEYKPLERLYYSGKVELQRGEGQLVFTPRSGEYEIRLWGPEQLYPTVQRVEAWEYGGDVSLQGDPEGWVELTPQKKSSYSVGEEVALLLKLPVEGRVLVTVERDQVLWSRWVRSENRVAEVRFPLKEGYAPGIYVHALAIHKAGNKIPFRVSRGLIYIPVESPDKKLSVEVQAPERALPGEKIVLQVRTGRPGSRIVLAGVDQGLLALQRGEVGSPYDFFYQKRAYGLRVSEQLPYSAPWGPRTVGGGDSEQRTAEAPSPELLGLSEVEEKAIAFFWPDLQADNKGSVQVEVSLPAFTGRLRWRAYVLEEDRFGMGEAHTTVALPVVARLSIPFFLSGGDEVEMPLRLRNTTGAVQQGTWTLSVEGAGVSLSRYSGAFSLAPHVQSVEKIYVRATAPLGRVKVTLVVQGQRVQEREIRIRPAEAPQRVFSVYTLSPGDSLTFSLPGEMYIPPTRRVRLVVGSIEGLSLAGPLWELMKFPHGCGEQITSQAFAALMAGEWLKAITGLPDDTLRARIRATITLLQALHTSEGGFSYWPGGNADGWLSVYVTHFLHEAKKAGYTEVQPLLDKAIAYQSALLPAYAPSSRTQAYRALLLSQVMGEKVKASMPSITEVEKIADPVIRSLWRGAFAQLKLPLPKPAVQDVQWTRQLGGELISHYREQALWIYAESQVPPEHRVSTVNQDARTLLASRLSHLSTQEAAWLVLAAIGVAKSKPYAALIEVGEKRFSPQQTIEGYEVAPLAGQMCRIRHVKGMGPLYVAVIAEGLPLATQPAQEKGLRLHSTWEAEGSSKAISFSQIEVGRRFRWVLQIHAREELSLPAANIAVTVPLPAGWQADNPRLLSGVEESPVRGAEVVYVDRREDRLLYYLTLTDRKATFEIPIQVVHAGRYALPSVSVEALYDPTLYGTTSSQQIIVGGIP